jgi:hypothetical protein
MPAKHYAFKDANIWTDTVTGVKERGERRSGCGQGWLQHMHVGRPSVQSVWGGGGLCSCYVVSGTSHHHHHQTKGSGWGVDRSGGGRGDRGRRGCESEGGERATNVEVRAG